MMVFRERGSRPWRDYNWFSLKFEGWHDHSPLGFNVYHGDGEVKWKIRKPAPAGSNHRLLRSSRSSRQSKKEVAAQVQFLQELKKLFNRKGHTKSAEKSINLLCVLRAFSAFFAVASSMSHY